MFSDINLSFQPAYGFLVGFTKPFIVACTPTVWSVLHVDVETKTRCLFTERKIKVTARKKTVTFSKTVRFG